MKGVKIDNEINSIYIEEGIVFASYKAETIVTMEIARNVLQDRLAVTGDKKYPLCGDIRNLLKVEDDARAFLGTPEAFKGISALAIITSSTFQKLFANFYLRFKVSPIPTRLFTTKAKAIFWLKNHSELN